MKAVAQEVKRGVGTRLSSPRRSRVRLQPLFLGGAQLDFVILTGLPLPPSINESYLNNRGGRGRGRVKSGAYRLFERELAVWTLRNRAIAEQAMALVTDEGWINLDAYFCFPYKKLVTKAGLPKRHDVDNRLKALNDSLGKALGFDDGRIVSQRIEKVAIAHAQAPWVNVMFTRAPGIATSCPWTDSPPQNLADARNGAV